MNSNTETSPHAHVEDDDLIRGWRELCAIVRKSRVQVWRDVRNGKFPSPIELGPNSIGWHRAEVMAWRASRPRRHYGQQQNVTA